MHFNDSRTEREVLLRVTIDDFLTLSLCAKTLRLVLDFFISGTKSKVYHCLITGRTIP